MAGTAVEANDPPPAPGALGVVLPPRAILDYLSAAMRWRDTLRGSLDTLDRRARSAANAAGLTTDVTLAYAMVNAISTRLDEMVKVWDSGRVLAPECERISQLLWGRMDGAAGIGMSVSYVEACVLAQAITERLRERLDADAMAGGIGERVAALKAQIVRLRSMAAEAGAAAAPIDQLQGQLDAAIKRIDDGEPIEPDLVRIESVAGVAERDAIIAGARRQTLGRDIETLRDRLAAAADLEAAARRDAASCVEKIADPPRLAVPSVGTLGHVPTDRDAVDAFAARLAAVERAVREAAGRFAAPLAERSDLRGLLESYKAMAGGRGYAEDLNLDAAYRSAHDVLWSAPCDLALARALVGAYQSLVRTATSPRPGEG